MPLRRGDGEASAGEGEALEAALLQAAEVLAEALRQRLVERAEQRARKPLANHEEADRARFQKVVMDIERKLEAIGDRSDVLENRLERLEEKVSTAFEQLLYLSARERSYAQQSELKMLERRLKCLEIPSHSALNECFSHEPTFAMPEKPSSVKMGLASAAVSSSPSSLLTRMLTSPTTTMTTEDAEVANPVQNMLTTEELLEKRKIKVLVQTVKMKRDFSRASPSELGEDLCLAAYNGRLREIQELIDLGADVNYTDKEGFTPLLRALCSITENASVVSLLIDKGADVNVVSSNGASAMHFAAINDCTGRCVKVLLGSGGNVNARDEQGATPLHLAAEFDHEQVVELLLEAGARKDVRCWSGERKNALPYDYALSDTLCELLRL